jgi:hypothetical protein
VLDEQDINKILYIALSIDDKQSNENNDVIEANNDVYMGF